MNEYLIGKKLYGDDFNGDQIEKWFKEEAEGYANLGNKDKSNYLYGYHEMNKFHGFNKLKEDYFEKVLGFGSAWGYEFEPILEKIGSLTIIDPSDNMQSTRLGKLVPKYVKPEIDGTLKFSSNSFNLITCFGTLHHIPNVTYVITELIRVLKLNGYLILREPITSMGDWNFPRIGLTKNERGIPTSFFDNLFKIMPVEVVSKEYCFTISSLLQRTLGRFFKKPIYSYKLYVLFDKQISALLKMNVKYHAEKKRDKIAPSNIFYVIKKVSSK